MKGPSTVSLKKPYRGIYGSSVIMNMKKKVKKIFKMTSTKKS